MRLIEFGSLYGSYRINLEGADPKWQSLLNTIQKSMAFEHGLLQTVSDDLQSLLGGRGAYIGVHLRVGDGAFKVSSSHFFELCLSIPADHSCCEELVSETNEIIAGQSASQSLSLQYITRQQARPAGGHHKIPVRS